jgi:PrtD family type I secretion system ABC transporter
MSTPPSNSPRQNAIAAAVRRCRRTFSGIALFSGVINVLALTGSLYMLQVYDRVIPSRSIPTLIGLTVLMVILYAGYGLLDLVRTRIMARVGVTLDRELRDKAFAAVLLVPLRAKVGGDGQQPIRDLDQIRGFLSGAAPTALFDMPWMPFYLILIYLLHPWLGMLATVGAAVLVALALVTEAVSRGPSKELSASASKRQVFGEAARRNAEVIRAMGMGRRVGDIWGNHSRAYLAHHMQATDVSANLSSVAKILRMLLQSFMLGLGAFLVVAGEATGGVMIASSITLSRALAPIEIAIANWKGFLAARQAYQRLNVLFDGLAAVPDTMPLPRPHKTLHVENLSIAAPGQQKPIIQNVSFELRAGSAIGVIGPSASGKSTLARALVGVWVPLPMRGAVRLDGAALEQWDPEALGADIGYLPQDIELFDGTVQDNIARFDPNGTSERVIAAAQAADIHEMILRLPEGYTTRIGEGGASLSAGQRQRLGLARALYGDPFLVVLDEPNSNLDATGEAALTQAITAVRNRGGIVVVIAHRPSALAAVDHVLAMSNGQMQAFGPRDEVMRKVMEGQRPAPVPGAPTTSPAGAPTGAPGLKIIAQSADGRG